MDQSAVTQKTGHSRQIKGTNSFNAIDSKQLTKIIAEATAEKNPMSLPHGFPTHPRRANLVLSKSRSLKSDSWILESPDTPTIIIKKLSKVSPSSGNEPVQPSLHFGSSDHQRQEGAALAGICLFSIDLDKSVEFYNSVLGLPVLARSQSQVQLDHHLVLRKGEIKVPAGAGTIVFIRHSDLDGCLRRLSASRIEVSDSGKGNRRKITCLDPDGRTVELIETQFSGGH